MQTLDVEAALKAWLLDVSWQNFKAYTEELRAQRVRSEWRGTLFGKDKTLVKKLRQAAYVLSTLIDIYDAVQAAGNKCEVANAFDLWSDAGAQDLSDPNPPVGSTINGEYRESQQTSLANTGYDRFIKLWAKLDPYLKNRKRFESEFWKFQDSNELMDTAREAAAELTALLAARDAVITAATVVEMATAYQSYLEA